VGRLLQQHRKALFPEGEKFAQAIGISQPTLSRIESGAVSVSVEQLRRLTAALGTTPAEILAQADAAAASLPRQGVQVVEAGKESDQVVALLTGAALAAVLFAVLASNK
jgi:transcriptional regulator with XRE-family HTH domain